MWRENRIYGPNYGVSLTAACELIKVQTFSEEEQLSVLIEIDNYHYPKAEGNASEEEKQMYTDLFKGETSSYEKYINWIYMPRDFSSEQPTSFFDFLDLLESNDFEDSQSAENPTQTVTDFQYEHYKGAHGNIIQVQFSYEYNDKTINMIKCFREDIPYVVTGAFDDSLELSSGDIALWVASSLKVTEHFIIKGTEMQKKD